MGVSPAVGAGKTAAATEPLRAFGGGYDGRFYAGAFRGFFQWAKADAVLLFHRGIFGAQTGVFKDNPFVSPFAGKECLPDCGYHGKQDTRANPAFDAFSIVSELLADFIIEVTGEFFYVVHESNQLTFNFERHIKCLLF